MDTPNLGHPKNSVIKPLAKTEVGSGEDQPSRDKLIHVQPCVAPILIALSQIGALYTTTLSNPLHGHMKAKVILITDDDDDDRYFLKQAIERKMAKVLIIEARDGQEALQTLSEESTTKINLVLLDVNMPGMDGIEVLERIRNETPLQHIPAVMISTSDEPNLVSTAYAKGINSYIRKPNKISEYDQIAEAIKVCFLDTTPSF